jgi:hypothetical protein
MKIGQESFMEVPGRRLTSFVAEIKEVTFGRSRSTFCA